MTCLELRESLVEQEDGSRPEQRAHLKDCSECATLVADLLVIACAAGELRASHEPSPRVWNSIEIALRQEGLIKPQHSHHSLLPSFGSSWGWSRWLAPVAALLLIAAGIYVRQYSHGPAIARNEGRPTVQAPVPDTTIAGLNASLKDDDLLQGISQQSPALQATYTDNLRRVNQYIQDARSTVDADPSDEDARRSLMEAYQQKAMLFELALDRSLP
ncbi:MAG TPA: hypothetical protein VKB49_22935 [Candidatus Sulfotelmatobacter sp.]|nr:hypothetical protein [Candidatus Sulfotelmatobacter sp.]